MATVSGSDRGQLIIVAAMGLAVTFVALALILNSAIYTGNLASRNVQSGASETITSRQAAVEGVGGIVDGVNDPSTATDYATLEANYRDAVAEWADIAARYGVLEETSVQVAASRTDDGSLLVDRGVRIVDANRSSTLTPNGGTPVDWTVAPDVRARDVQFVITDAPTTPTDAEVESELASGSWTEGSFFYVDVDDGEWRLAVYEDGRGAIKVAVYDGATGTFSVCPRTPVAAPARIDVDEGTINGVRCEAFATVDAQTGPYDIHVANGDRATGAYDLTVDRMVDGPTSSAGTLTDVVDRRNYGAFCADEANGGAYDAGPTYVAVGAGYPTVAPALYAARVDLDIHGSTVDYHRRVRVASGELSVGATRPRLAAATVDDRSDANRTERASFSVDWTAADANGDLESVTVELLDAGSVVDTATATGLGGRSATGTLDVSGDLPLGSVYELRTTVTDAAGRSRSVTWRHEAEDGGDDSGCPP